MGLIKDIFCCGYCLKSKQETPQSPEASPEAGQNSDGSPNENINQVAQNLYQPPSSSSSSLPKNPKPPAKQGYASVLNKGAAKGRDTANSSTKSESSSCGRGKSVKGAALDPTQAATLIQAAYRGFQTRKLFPNKFGKKKKGHASDKIDNGGDGSSAAYSSMAGSQGGSQASTTRVKTTKL